jgi:SAM-dependent methyltransferase
LIVEQVFKNADSSKMKMLHVAPEPFLRPTFLKRFGTYETADLTMKGVNHHVDLQQLPFEDATYDLVFASHVLEHIPDDARAISEIRRILKPGGIAILPVPVICERTVEYPEANPHEAYHFRAPGWDYFDRYKQYFGAVKVYTSDAVAEEYQTFIYEDRTGWPTNKSPLRPPMQGAKHLDAVPVCYV